MIQSGDHRGRTCVVKWIKLSSTGDDVEVSVEAERLNGTRRRCRDVCFVDPQVLGVEEDVSVYDIADHPDFHFRTTDIVIRIWNSENRQNDCDNEVK